MGMGCSQLHDCRVPELFGRLQLVRLVFYVFLDTRNIVNEAGINNERADIPNGIFSADSLLI